MFSKSMVSMLGLVAVVAGCSDVHTPVDASAISGGASRNAVSLAGKGEKPIGIEATFLAIADSAPGFGGVYIDKDGQTRMAVTTAANVPQVLSRVRQHYAGLAEEGYLNSVIPTIVPYNYRQLYTWKEALQAKLQGQQIAGSAIHVSTNTVDVFAKTADGDNAALVAADTMGLPRSAVRVMRVGQLEAFGDLKDKFSPGIAGGVAITTYFPPPYPDSGAGCTLGVNVKLTYTDTAWDALTAAHCTATIGGGPDPTLMAQPGNWPSYSAGDRMAHEVADPYWQSCPQGVGKQYCRYADVAAFQYDRTRVADSGYVDVTVKLDSMTTKWISKDSTSRRVTGYWSDQPWEGVDLEHVGVTTGWHSGTVEESCLNTPVVVYGYSTDHEWLCQTKVDGIANHGDSGGPVFSAGPGRNILFAGLLSEGDTASNYYYMSSYANICLDFNACPVVTWF